MEDKWLVGSDALLLLTAQSSLTEYEANRPPVGLPGSWITLLNKPLKH